MSCLGNVIWFIFGGLIGGLSWLAAGVLWCITIIGIPIGMQCFKIASLSFCAFWQRSNLPPVRHVIDCQHHLADRFRSPNCSGTCRQRHPSMYHDYRDTICKAIFQTCSIGVDAIWCRDYISQDVLKECPKHVI